MAVTAAQTVADYLIWLSAKHGDWLTNKKLQKLLYYMQGWHLAFDDEPLYDEQIEAWIHGPVVRAVWTRYRDSGWEPLPIKQEEPEFPADLKELAQEIINVYGIETAYQLEMRTHRERPWLEAREGYSDTDPCDVPIKIETMRDFFKGQLASGQI